jgi:phage gp36-like protein
MSEAHRICSEAAELVMGSRAGQHGPKVRNHQNIADHWNAYLGERLTMPLTALDVALMMVELKIARTKLSGGRSNRDNYVDMAGYAGVAGEIALNGKEV